uniref:MD-2-related lipid-recognition domain-containing protein n=1 Tax=Anopheles farauti TaxID=69004 RepID=A0A182QJC3_9DIPT
MWLARTDSEAEQSSVKRCRLLFIWPLTCRLTVTVADSRPRRRLRKVKQTTHTDTETTTMDGKSGAIMQQLLLLLCAVICLSSIPAVCRAAEFGNCANETAVGKYSLVEVSNCADDDASCVLKRNSNATISITFTSSEDLPELKAVVHGIILGMEVPFRLPNDDGCKDSGLECPLAKETSYRYSTTLPVLKQYPKVSVEVKWELKAGEKDVVCVLIPAKIQ